jgi:hypothetical protein
VPSDDRDWAASFSEVFAQPESAVEARAWATALGGEYPAEIAPYSYTSRTELARIAAEVNVGPGLWVAATTGASYLAFDIAAAGLVQVRDRAARLGLADRVRTAEGSFENLPLPDAGATATSTVS